ncbi:hypothetical protein SPF06_00845 [Sinomonas sp. JGH33]|uniref:Uncharacterized protein n=1 Tax=Sinomonas terricola TaxID=3110330 RepID=A0ABU5T0S4_9MICC|nr:hypothetical protein [Sinomonas sp. JGH33]MEA5453257.1 hypothetical protein [Sinomonas sp. JGH33]
MTAIHVEHLDDLTEHVEPIHVGFMDPHEQTGSDAETEPLDPRPHVPVAKRYDRWRLWRDEHGKWNAAQPNDLDPAYFVTAYEGHHDAPVTVRGYGYRHESRARVVDALSLALAKHEATL